MLGAAMPAVVLLQKQHILASATGALNSIGPTLGYEVFTAPGQIGEVNNSFAEGIEFHGLSMTNPLRFVKYIITSVVLLVLACKFLRRVFL